MWELEKKEQTKPKVSKRKEIIKIYSKNKWNRDKKNIEKTSGTKSWFLEKINKFNNLSDSSKKERRPMSIQSEMEKL